MKKADLKTGVVYAYKSGKYGVAPEGAAMILDTTRLWQGNGARFGRNDPAAPRFKPAGSYHNRPTRQGGNAVGYLAVGFGNLGGFESTRHSKTQATPEDLKGYDLDWAKAQTFADKIPDGMLLTVVDPRFLVGEYADMVQDAEDEQQRQANINAEMLAKIEREVELANQRRDALRGLGLPGVVERAEVKKVWSSSYGDWTPDQYERALVTGVVLSMVQVDALLSLIPEGATYVPDDVEDDGWTLKREGYDEDEEEG